ncbi:MAG: rod shape-determining protein MreD [Pseudomonadota bacterium]
MTLKRLELLIWLITPVIITCLLFMLCIIPNHIWGMGYVMPLLPLFPIFYWGTIQAQEMPYWFACLTGLMLDVVSGTPLGLSALLYLIFLVITHSQSKYIHKEGFMIMWGYFVMLVAIICASQWFIISLSGSQSQAIPAAFVQWLLTIGLYPLFHKLFDNIAEYIKQRRWILTHA